MKTTTPAGQQNPLASGATTLDLLTAEAERHQAAAAERFTLAEMLDATNPTEARRKRAVAEADQQMAAEMWQMIAMLWTRAKGQQLDETISMAVASFDRLARGARAKRSKAKRLEANPIAAARMYQSALEDMKTAQAYMNVAQTLSWYTPWGPNA